MAALALLRNRTLTLLLNHIETISWALQQWLMAGYLQYTYAKSAENWADVLTKVLPRPAYVLCVQYMRLPPLVFGCKLYETLFCRDRYPFNGGLPGQLCDHLSSD